MLELLRSDDRLDRLRSARRESGERVAQRPWFCFTLVGMAAVEMDELAELIDVLDRVLQRRLPAGKQRNGEKDPR